MHAGEGIPLGGDIVQIGGAADIRDSPDPLRMLHIGTAAQDGALQHRQPGVDRQDGQRDALSGFLFPAEKNDQQRNQQAHFTTDKAHDFSDRAIQETEVFLNPLNQPDFPFHTFFISVYKNQSGSDTGIL